MLVVPACQVCQGIKGLGDSDLPMFVNLDILGGYHPDSWHHIEKIVGRGEKTQDWLKESLATAVDIGRTVTDLGTVLPGGVEIPYNFERVMTTMGMIVRGLYFDEKKRMLPVESPVEVELVPWYKAEDVVRRLSSVRVHPPVFKGNNVAWYIPFLPVDVPDDSSAWLICFNNGVVFLGFTGFQASERKRLKVEARLETNRKNGLRAILAYTADS